MSEAAPSSTQRIIPCLHYADAHAALGFLCDAFGFERGLVAEGEDGGIDHAELHLAGDMLMLASPHAAAGLSAPSQLGGFHAHLTVYVPDLGAHYAQAVAAGTEITQEPILMPYGDRRYTARDCEGYRWSFHERIRDTSEAEAQSALEKAGE